MHYTTIYLYRPFNPTTRHLKMSPDKNHEVDVLSSLVSTGRRFPVTSPSKMREDIFLLKKHRKNRFLMIQF